MPRTRTARTVLDRDFLEIRARLLDIAAALDRIDRADDARATESDPRVIQLRDGIDALHSAGPDRASAIQLIFSDPYVENWQSK